MRQTILGMLAVSFLSIATYLIGEGIYAIARWDRSASSVTYRIYQHAARDWDDDTATDLDAHAKEKPSVRAGPPYTWLLGRDELDRLIPKFKLEGVALGNVPERFDVLRSDKVSVNRVVDGCRSQKPLLRKTMTFLRANMFNPFDPLNIFFDADRDLDPQIRELIAAYGVRQITHTTNQYGERTTVPVVASDRKVIVAGASQANGMMVNDSETLSSQLQALDRSRQYINLGIGGAKAADTICALNKGAQRYRGQIDELIYIYSESNFRSGRQYRKPKEIIDWIKGFADAESIGKVTIVFTPKIYNIVPQITRLSPTHYIHANTFVRERALLAKLAVDVGFRFINVAHIALAEVDRTGTQFAALSVFVDHGHWSPYGTARLAERILRE